MLPEKYSVRKLIHSSGGELEDLGVDTLASLLAGELAETVLVGLGLPVSSILGGLGGSKVGVLANLGVSVLVNLLESISCKMD